MPFTRLAIAAALAAALVLPSTASAKAPSAGDAAHHAALQTLIKIQDQQINALRSQVELTRHMSSGAVIAAILQPRIDTLVEARRRAQLAASQNTAHMKEMAAKRNEAMDKLTALMNEAQKAKDAAIRNLR